MKRTSSQQNARRQSVGFTLIELLVAVGLTILMMSLFTVIFSLASGSVTTQRGIARNDQKARTMVTILRNDIRSRTFRSVIPFEANEVDGTVPAFRTGVPDDSDFNRRRGYFYYSENDVESQTDDVFALTVEVSSDDPLFGKAVTLGVPEVAPEWTASTDYQAGDWVETVPALPRTDPNRRVYLAVNGGTSGTTTPPSQTTGDFNDNGITWRAFEPESNRNQMEWDDNIGGNGSGQSVNAEIAIFLRGDKLIRRVLLIRSLGVGVDPQPEDTTAPDTGGFFDRNFNAPAYSGNFWGDFDYSAHQELGTSGTTPDTQEKVILHGTDALTNTTATNYEDVELGRPRFRFGFNHATGQPKEYLQGNGAANFIGRYLHEETSYPGFQYPHRDTAFDVSGTPAPLENPMLKQSTAPGMTTLNSRNVVTAFAGGVRRSEDVLMDNVLRFDVKVWDPQANGFVDVGNTLPTGSSLFRGPNSNHVTASIVYGPQDTVAENHVFDTWHPTFDPRTVNTSGTAAPPPYSMPARLRAVQLNIQYFDPQTGQVREVTINESLLD